MGYHHPLVRWSLNTGEARITAHDDGRDHDAWKAELADAEKQASDVSNAWYESPPADYSEDTPDPGYEKMDLAERHAKSVRQQEPPRGIVGSVLYQPMRPFVDRLRTGEDKVVDEWEEQAENAPDGAQLSLFKDAKIGGLFVSKHSRRDGVASDLLDAAINHHRALTGDTRVSSIIGRDLSPDSLAFMRRTLGADQFKDFNEDNTWAHRRNSIDARHAMDESTAFALNYHEGTNPQTALEEKLAEVNADSGSGTQKRWLPQGTELRSFFGKLEVMPEQRSDYSRGPGGLKWKVKNAPDAPVQPKQGFWDWYPGQMESKHREQTPYETISDEDYWAMPLDDQLAMDYRNDAVEKKWVGDWKDSWKGPVPPPEEPKKRGLW